MTLTCPIDNTLFGLAWEVVDKLEYGCKSAHVANVTLFLFSCPIFPSSHLFVYDHVKPNQTKYQFGYATRNIDLMIDCTPFNLIWQPIYTNALF